MPGEAASIVTGQELVVPRWHMCIVNPVTQYRHAHFRPRAIIWNLFGDNQLTMAELLTQKNTEAAIDLDGLAIAVFFTWD